MADEVNDRGLLVLARLIDQLQERHTRAMRHTTEDRNTFSDGFANGVSEALSLVSAGIRADVPFFDERLAKLGV
jgi:hypothetical protein